MPEHPQAIRVVVKDALAETSHLVPMSRSQARRVARELAGLEVVELDFNGVSEIGQGFADELFRVFANAHPKITLKALHAGPGVAPMIRRVRPDAEITSGSEN